MINLVKKDPLATSQNDVVTPLYFDRQIVRAADLMLDRVSHDQELERMRRLLHGWGVVAGFAFLKVEADKGILTIGKGYGITPNGHEIYLTQSVALTDLVNRVDACCGPDSAGCDIVDEAERLRIAENHAKGFTEGWLVARPHHTDGDYRTGVPDGCQHPANALLPARRCEGIRFDIVCTLDFPHVQTPKSCEELTDWMCKVPATGRLPLPMPGMVPDENDFLVLAKIRIEDGKQSITYEDRRLRLPVSVLQDWVSACMCAAKPAPVTTTTTVTTTKSPTTTKSATTTAFPGATINPGVTIGPGITFNPGLTLNPGVTFNPGVTLFTTQPPSVTFNPLTTLPIFTTLDPDIGSPVLEDINFTTLNNRAAANGLVESEILDVETQEKLTAVGIDSPAKLVKTDLDEVSVATGVPKAKLELMKKDALSNRVLFGGPQF
jgi:hypothetical protein